MWMGTKLPYLQKLRGRLGWQPPEAVATVAIASDAAPPDMNLPETPEFPQIQFTII